MTTIFRRTASAWPGRLLFDRFSSGLTRCLHRHSKLPLSTVPNNAAPSSCQKMLPSVPTDIINFLRLKCPASAVALVDRVFMSGGKLIRPRTALIMSDMCNRVSGQASLHTAEKQYKIAMVAEMIHVASLVHDDIVDQSSTRRGVVTINESDGCSMAVFLGDLILAQATYLLTTVGNSEVIEILSQVIEDLVRGELMQAGHIQTEQSAFSEYILKTYKKTGSLFSNSMKAVAVLAECQEELVLNAANFGRNFGIMFQLIDDLLDFTSTNESLGKPAGADLKAGLITGPVLFAARQYPEILAIVKRNFSHQGDFERCLSMVMDSDGLLRTKQLAEQFSAEAIRCLQAFPGGEETAQLQLLCQNRLNAT